MDYSNPEVPHDVNVSSAKEDRKILWYLLYIVIGIISLFIFLRILLPFIPFEYEHKLSSAITHDIPRSKNNEPAEEYLLQLANQLASHMDIPSNYTLNVIILNSDERNAFATLGGNIIITTGLLKLLNSENALSMVLGHEIAHIKHRDPIRSAGSQMFIIMAFTLVSSVTDMSSLNSITSLTSNTFSRQQETAADVLAIHAVKQHYGHTIGIEEFFEKIDHLPFGVEFLSTHPQTKDRLQRIYNSQKGVQGQLTPLPEILKNYQK